MACNFMRINSWLLYLIDILMYCDCKCSVALPHGAVGWSALCDVVFSDHTHLLFVIKKSNLYL